MTVTASKREAMRAHTIIVVRGREQLTLSVPHTTREFGGVPIDMIGRVNLGPFAPAVPITMPAPKQKEPKRKPAHKDDEDEPARLI